MSRTHTFKTFKKLKNHENFPYLFDVLICYESYRYAPTLHVYRFRSRSKGCLLPIFVVLNRRKRKPSWYSPASSTIQLVSPLTKEQVSIDNGGGGNWGTSIKSNKKYER